MPIGPARAHLTTSLCVLRCEAGGGRTLFTVITSRDLEQDGEPRLPIRTLRAADALDLVRAFLDEVAGDP